MARHAGCRARYVRIRFTPGPPAHILISQFIGLRFMVVKLPPVILNRNTILFA